MATTTQDLDGKTVPRGGERFTRLGDLAKFAGLAAVLAMVADALIAHGMLWTNDPYWTYWVTDTLLITTVFGLGTAWLGIGVGRGAILTAVQTLVLTVYYWSLAPIGLPAQPEWLDLQHTWVTGVPVHFAVYYLGYLTALWLWRRRSAVRAEAVESVGSVAGDAGRALAVAAGVVVAVGALQSALLGELPGVSWFVMRLVVAVAFTLAWWSVAGRDRASAVGGGLVLAVVLAAYGHYLGPVSLPDTNARVIAQDPPPTTVHWLSYREEFLAMLPVIVVVAVLVFLAASVWRGNRWNPIRLSRANVVATIVALGGLVALGAVTAAETGRDDVEATVTSSGAPSVEQGEYYEGDLVPAEGELRLKAAVRNHRQTPLRPHDTIDLAATVTHPDGTRFEVEATQPMISDSSGRSGTWGGVGFDRWHHGRSGLGTDELPATRSEVAMYGLADVSAGGDLVATGVPVHVMTVDGGGVELHVGDPASPVVGLPDGHLRAVWDARDGNVPEGPERARTALGSGVLIALLALVGTALRTDARRRPELAA